MLTTTSLFAALTTLAVVSAYTGDPFWVIRHDTLMSTRLDPIINPGSVGGHVHAIVGSSAFGPTYDYDTYRAAECTTANMVQDLSNYWVPQLYRKFSNGSFGVAPFQYANTYYEVRRRPNEPVYEFPPGFRMTAGNPSRSTYDPNNPAHNAITYACLNYNVPPTPPIPGFPTTYCPQGLRTQINFPHCWDGINNWLEGSAHVAYANVSRADGGDECPRSHPKRLVMIFYEFIFQDDYAYEAGARVLATGDNIGYGFHGDFVNGWPEGFFKNIFDYGSTCAVEFGLDQCPPFVPFLTPGGNSGNCNPQNVRVDEDIGFHNNLTQLPGNNPIWGGSVAKVPRADYVETAEFQSVVPPIPSNWNYLGCMAEPKGGRALLGASTKSPSMTPDLCISYCAGQGMSYAGVEYSVECYCANSLSNGASASVLLNSSSCSDSCPGLDYGSGYCGGGSKLSLFQFAGTGSVSAAPDAQGSLLKPTGAPNPTEIVASGVQMDTISGDGAYTGYTGPAVGGAGTATAPGTGNPVATASTGSSTAALVTAGTMSASAESSGVKVVTVPSSGTGALTPSGTSTMDPKATNLTGGTTSSTPEALASSTTPALVTGSFSTIATEVAVGIPPSSTDSVTTSTHKSRKKTRTHTKAMSETSSVDSTASTPMCKRRLSQRVD